MLPGSSEETTSLVPTKLVCHNFPISEIQLATQDFNERLRIGKGGFGKVYKGKLKNGTVAIKRLDSSSAQGATEFWAEVEMLSMLRHCNLVALIGYCNDNREMILIYEYMPNGTLEDHLHKLHTPLSFKQRLKICIGAARGLQYLHTGTDTEQGIIHRDVKSSNILLDNNWAAKISDFGLSKISPIDKPLTGVDTIIKGTFGYFDPNYFSTGRLTRKSDVFSFGVILLEVLCRKRAVDSSLDKEQWSLVEWAQNFMRGGKLNEIIDPYLTGGISRKCLNGYAKIVDGCLQSSPKQRITMANVVCGLESILALHEKSDNSIPEMGLVAFGRKFLKSFFSTEENSGNNNNNSRVPNPSHNNNTSCVPNPSYYNNNSGVLTPSHNSNNRGVPIASHNYNNRGVPNPYNNRGVPNPSYSNLPNNVLEELVTVGWPSWLVAVTGEALKGWLPRRFDTFENLAKIGQGRYSNVYKARDMQTGNVVALKQIMFNCSDPESVKMGAMEIVILRQLDHPNVIKLEGIVTSGMSETLYLVFEYMDHDLATLFADTAMQFTKLEVKHYMRQLLSGLKYCHDHQVLHRELKGSDLLLNNNGVLKIADFGSASFFGLIQEQPMTNFVVTYWYWPPELLLGALDYGVGVDLWSAGCILARLLIRKPFLDGYTKDEQLKKIYALCGPLPDGYWTKYKLRLEALYMPGRLSRRCLRETFEEFPPSALSLLDVLLSVDPTKRGNAASALESEFLSEMS